MLGFPRWPNRNPADPPPWVRHLENCGFTTNTDGQFTRESTAVRIDDNRLVVESPPGTPVWSLDLTGTDEIVAAHAVKMLLQFRPSLLPPHGLDAEVEQRITERALDRLQQSIQSSPSHSVSKTLRRFLWSLCNQQHRTDLLHTVPIMDPVRFEWMMTVRAAALLGRLSVDEIKSALRRAGEIQDLEDHKPYEHCVITLEEVLAHLSDELQRPLPESTSQAVRRAIQALTDARDALRSTEQPHRSKSSNPL